MSNSDLQDSPGRFDLNKFHQQQERLKAHGHTRDVRDIRGTSVDRAMMQSASSRGYGSKLNSSVVEQNTYGNIMSN